MTHAGLFGRDITYLRLSLTDRCDLRCTYCMPERMAFLPRQDILTLDELDRVASCFIRRGVRKLRLTGGEPLVRKGAVDLVTALGRHLRSGALDELTLTTNGSQLAVMPRRCVAAGVRRINVSLDHLDPEQLQPASREAATFAKLWPESTRRKQPDWQSRSMPWCSAATISTIFPTW